MIKTSIDLADAAGKPKITGLTGDMDVELQGKYFQTTKILIFFPMLTPP